MVYALEEDSLGFIFRRRRISLCRHSCALNQTNNLWRIYWNGYASISAKATSNSISSTVHVVSDFFSEFFMSTHTHTHVGSAKERKRNLLLFDLRSDRPYRSVLRCYILFVLCYCWRVECCPISGTQLSWTNTGYKVLNGFAFAVPIILLAPSIHRRRNVYGFDSL